MSPPSISALQSLTIVAGLPGAGKTTWGRAQCDMLGSIAVLVDDPSVNNEQWKEVHDEHIHVFVADPFWSIMDPSEVIDYIQEHLDRFDPTQTVVNWVCFENDLDRCLDRARPNVYGFAHRLHHAYQIPPGATVLPLDSTTTWFQLTPMMELPHVRSPHP